MTLGTSTTSSTTSNADPYDFSYLELGDGFCDDYKNLPDIIGEADVLTDSSDPLYNADRIKECANRCIKASETPSNNIKANAFYIKDNRCGCSKDTCVIQNQYGGNSYTSYSITMGARRRRLSNPSE